MSATLSRRAGLGHLGKRAIRIAGGTLRRTDDGLVYDADEKHRQALLKGLGLSKESSQMVSSAVLQELLEARRANKFWSWAATLNYMRTGRSDAQHAAM